MSADASKKLPHTVPREYVGQARLFCVRIEAAAKIASAAVQQIGADARAIVQHRSSWRAEHFPGFERQWRQTLPDEGRIGLAIERNKRELTIAEVRLSPSRYEDVRWSQPFLQHSLGLMLCTFRLTTPAAFEIRRQAIAIIGIHAIGRRYQRGFDNTDRAIQTDISELAVNGPQLLGADSPAFSIPCLSGIWVGAIEPVSVSGSSDQRLLNVRSFISHP
jgi:hypothetical protein